MLPGRWDTRDEAEQLAMVLSHRIVDAERA
jgi:hypothetical protein